MDFVCPDHQFEKSVRWLSVTLGQFEIISIKQNGRQNITSNLKYVINMLYFNVKCHAIHGFLHFKGHRFRIYDFQNQNGRRFQDGGHKFKITCKKQVKFDVFSYIYANNAL